MLGGVAAGLDEGKFEMLCGVALGLDDGFFEIGGVVLSGVQSGLKVLRVGLRLLASILVILGVSLSFLAGGLKNVRLIFGKKRAEPFVGRRVFGKPSVLALVVCGILSKPGPISFVGQRVFGKPSVLALVVCGILSKPGPKTFV